MCKTNRKLAALVVSAVTFVAAEQATAAPIGIEVETLSASAIYTLIPAVGPPQVAIGQSAPPLPNGSDTQSTVSFGGGDDDTMTAITTQTWENGNDLSYDASFSSGRDANYKYLGQASSLFSVTNTTSAQQFLTYDFELTDMFVDFEGAYGDMSDNPFDNRDLEGAAAVRLRMELFELGAGQLYEAEYEVWAHAANGSATFEVGTQNKIFAIAITPKESFGGFIFGYRFDLLDVMESIDLGLFAPGVSKTLDSRFSMEVIQATREIKIKAGAADPGFLPDRIRLTNGGPPSAVPLPATAWMMLIGLGIMAGLRRSRALYL